MNYSEQYKHPKWQKKRLEILERDEYICQWCGNKEKTLHVHHKSYNNEKKVWDYPEDNFITYCEECHKEVHENKEKLRFLVDYYFDYPDNFDFVFNVLKEIKDYTPPKQDLLFEFIKFLKYK